MSDPDNYFFRWLGISRHDVLRCLVGVVFKYLDKVFLFKGLYGLLLRVVFNLNDRPSYLSVIQLLYLN